MDDLTPPQLGTRVAGGLGAAPHPLGCFAVGATHPGLRRVENEDALAVEPSLGLVVVADGVSASGGGGIAAETVVEALRGFFGREHTRQFLASLGPDAPHAVPPLLLASVVEAHHRMRRAADACGFHEMATTLAMVLLLGDHAFIAHAGDSRVYRVRPGHIEQLTRDHTALNAWIDRNGQPSVDIVNRLEHVLVRAVSARFSEVEPELRVEPLRPGDLFLVCSDGLTKVVEDEVLHDLAMAGGDLERVVQSLVAAALAGGGPDNITAALMRRR